MIDDLTNVAAVRFQARQLGPMLSMTVKQREECRNWVDWLRSGVYKQGRGFLSYREDGEMRHCCLGVAACIQNLPWVESDMGQRSYSVVVSDIPVPAHAALLPFEWFGDVFGLQVAHRDKLIQLNDNGASFKEIADIISGWAQLDEHPKLVNSELKEFVQKATMRPMALTEKQAENVRAWIKELRSGVWPQTTGALRRVLPWTGKPVGYCCLGVACVIQGVKTKEQPNRDGTLEFRFPIGVSDGSHTVMAGVPDSTWFGETYGISWMSYLFRANDSGASFLEIAEALEQALALSKVE